MILLPSWASHLRPRKRQVMSRTAHLPTVPTVLPLSVMDWSYDTEIANDLYQFTDNNCLCRRTLHIVSAQSTNKLTCLLSFSLFSLPSIASCISSLKHLECLPGSRKGVGEKRGERSLFLPFARPALSREQGSSLPRVHPQLPTGSWGPGSFTLISLLGCLAGPVCRVREKRASDALSLLVFFLLVFLLSTVFAQTQDALPQEAELDKALFYQFDSSKQWIFESTLRHSPPPEASNNSPLPRFSGTSLGKAQWPQECQLPAVDKLAPPLPTACHCFGMSRSMTGCHTLAS